MDKKKLSPKEIFRTLAFHYHLDDAISLEILSQMVSLMYYPADPTGEPRLRYKKLLLDFMKEYNNQQKTMNEQKFVKFMQQMGKHSNEQYLKKLTDRIFNRYRSMQDSNVIEQEGFVRMTKGFKIAEQDAREYFLSVADLKNQITRQKFHDYMNSMLSKK